MEDARLSPDNFYSKEEIESLFRTSFGARIKGITLRRTSEGEPYIIVFSSAGGPYEDRDGEGASFYHDGEGRDKDQELTAANKALINATKDDRLIYGFKQDESGGKWRYLGPLRATRYTYLPKNGYKTYEFQLTPRETANDKNTTRPATIPRIDTYLLAKQYALWKKFIESKDSHRFTAFSGSAYLKDQEDYKKDLNDKAGETLAVETWASDRIGSGEILDKVIAAIELKDNNLVFTSSYAYTRQGAPHDALLSAREEKNTTDLERILYDIYKDQIADQDGFTELVDLVGKRYGVIAYLFFIKNIRKYMPIAPSNFDRIFNELLGVNFKTSHNCSWENYEDYNGIIEQVAEFLSNELGERVSLIDSHSFLWMIGSQVGEENEEELIEVTATEVYVDGTFGFEDRKASRESLAPSTPLSIAASNQRNAIRGSKGEHIVVEYERNRLLEAGRSDLAEKVTRVSEENSSLGYDVLSYSALGNEVYIEVKTSSANNLDKLSFMLTPNEFKKCKMLNDYMIYAVCDVDNKPHIKYIRKPFNDVVLFDRVHFAGGMADPTQMRITLKLKQNVTNR